MASANPFTTADGNVDKIIGSSYDKVRQVAEALEYIKHVSANLEAIYTVAQGIEGVDAILEHMTVLGGLYDQLSDILTVAGIEDEIVDLSTNMVTLQAVQSEIVALTAIFDELPALTAAGDNIAAILVASENIQAIIDSADHAQATAADRALVAADKAAVAVDRADVAVNKALAQTARDQAEAFRDEALTAGENAWVLNKMFDDPAAGLLGTDLGDYFNIPSDDEDNSIEVYRHDAGPVATFIKAYPSTTEIINGRGGEDKLITRIEAATSRIVTDNPMLGATLWGQDSAGNSSDFSSTVNFNPERKTVEMDGFEVVFNASRNVEGLSLSDTAGNSQEIGGEETTETIKIMGFGPIFSPEETLVSETAGNTERIRLSTQSLDWAPQLINGVNALGIEGQSLAGIDSTTNRFPLDTLLAKLGLVDQAFSVGLDERSANPNGGATFDTIGNTRLLYPLREQVIRPSGTTSLIVSDADVASGNYPMNSRTGSFSPIALFVFQYLNMKYFEQAQINPLQKFYAGNKAKNEGSLAEILFGNGLLRAKDWARVYLEAAAYAPNGHSALARQFLAWLMNHGQHDEQPSGSSDYRGEWRGARINIWEDLQVKQDLAGFAQSKRPPWLISQVAGPFALNSMKAAQEQLNAALDLINDFDVMMVANDSELPHYGNMPDVLGTNPSSTTFPESGNPHPNWVGKILQGIRYGVALHEIFVRRNPYFIPFNHKFYLDGDRALFTVVNMGTGLRASPLPNGNDLHMPAHLGYSVCTSGGSEVPFIGIRVMPGATYSLEAKLAGDPGSGAYLLAGGKSATQTGQVFLRDNQKIELPRMTDWSTRLLTFANRYYSGKDYLNGLANATDPGVGYVDNIRTNGIGRLVAQTTGFFNTDLDLGNPCARGRVNSQQLN